MQYEEYRGHYYGGYYGPAWNTLVHRGVESFAKLVISEISSFFAAIAISSAFLKSLSAVSLGAKI